MTEPVVLKTNDGALWVVPDGPNNNPLYVACTDADNIVDPQGDVELIRCFNVWGQWKTVGEKISPPDKVTTTLTQLTFPTRTFLQRIRGVFGLIFTERDGGRADQIGNWVRALVLDTCRVTSKNYGGVLHHSDTNETTEALDISAFPPVIEVVKVTGQRLATTEVEDFTDVNMLPYGNGILPVKYGIAVAGATAGKANVYITDDGGASWTVCAAQPFAATQVIQACVIVDMGNNARRLIVARAAPAGAQGETAYSDDDGVTWTVISLGGAAAGDGPTHGGGMFALDKSHIWLASANGYIYFSPDAGQSWTVQDAGVVTAGDYTQIKMSANGTSGFACAAAGIVAQSIDGVNWSACGATIPATPALGCLEYKADGTVWVGTDTGQSWYSDDDGDTWTQRGGWTGSGAGKVQAIGFANAYVGFMLVDTAAPVGKLLRTIDGGYNWQVLTADANSGGTAFAIGDSNYLVYTGLVNAALGFIGVLVE